MSINFSIYNYFYFRLARLQVARIIHVHSFERILFAIQIRFDQEHNWKATCLDSRWNNYEFNTILRI